MQGSIPLTYNPGLYSKEKKENIGSQMGRTKKTFIIVDFGNYFSETQFLFH